MSYRDRDDRDRSNRDRGDRERGDRHPPSVEGLHSLKVDNISYHVTPNDLKDWFRPFGKIGDVYIPRDAHSRQSRGFGFVRFYNRKDADSAIDKMHGKVVDGRNLGVDYAKYDRPIEKHGYDPQYARRNISDSRGRYGRDREYDRRRSRSRSPRNRIPVRRRSRSRSASPSNRSRSPIKRSLSPARRSRSKSPIKRSRSPIKRSQSPTRRSRSRSPIKRSCSRSPIKSSRSPMKPSRSRIRRSRSRS